MFDFLKKKQIIREMTEEDYTIMPYYSSPPVKREPEPEAPKPIETKPSELSSIQVSKEFKDKLKALKGNMTYEDYIKKVANL